MWKLRREGKRKGKVSAFWWNYASNLGGESGIIQRGAELLWPLKNHTRGGKHRMGDVPLKERGNGCTFTATHTERARTAQQIVLGRYLRNQNSLIIKCKG